MICIDCIHYLERHLTTGQTEVKCLADHSSLGGKDIEKCNRHDLVGKVEKVIVPQRGLPGWPIDIVPGTVIPNKWPLSSNISKPDSEKVVKHRGRPRKNANG